jgi:PAS domain S-box-containing protein
VNPASLVGSLLPDLLGPELFALNEPYILAALGGMEQTFERIVPGPGGIMRHSLANYVPHTVDGVVVGFLVQVTDVTQLKQAQAALARNEEYLRELFTLAAEGVLVADGEGHYVDLNQASCDMLGYPREELLGKAFEDLLCKPELERLPAARARLRAGQLHAEEWAMQRKDGRVIAVEVRAKFLPDGRRVGYLRDVTGHKRMLESEHNMAVELERRVEQRTLELARINQELQLSHEALAASEQRYHTLVDWAPEPVAVHRGGRLIYVNPAAVRLIGASSAADLIGRPILELIHPQFHGFVTERVKRVAETGTPQPTAEVVLLGLDGRHIDVEIQGIPIDYEGRPALLSSIRDLTSQKQAEAALLKSKSLLRGIFDSATDGIVSADETQTIVRANPAAALMFGCTADDMIGSPLERFIPERHRQAHRHDVQTFGSNQARARHMGRTRDVMGLRADGEEFPIDVAISQLNLEGKPLYTAILRDITERRRAENELRAGKATLETALASMSDAVCIADTQGRLINVNEAFAAFHRFKGKEECRQTLAEYPALFDVISMNGETTALEHWPLPKALRGETATGVEYRLRRKDTGQTWVGSYSFAPIRTEEGAIVGAVFTARDITEIKARQAELEHAHADLQRLIESKDQVQEEERKRIARDLHDDLQQTLAAIRIDVGVIDQRLSAGPANVSPLLAKVDQLASAAIVSTRRIINDLRPQVLGDLGLASALELLARQFSQRTGIACHVEATDASSDALAGGSSIATALYRITQEALNNVFKHARASEVHIGLHHSENNELVLHITDNGVGMSVADRQKAQSFGLLGMQERVRALGGALSIESQLGAGTVIEVVAPLRGPLLGSDKPGPTRGPATGAGDTAGSSIQAAINALPGNIAVLDPQGVIRFVNRAWREFAQRNGDPSLIATGPQVNYLEVCRRSAQQDELASHVLKGLIEVMDGTRQEFMSAYPCHSPNEQRWFLVRVAPTLGGHFQVTHMDVTHLAEPVRMPPAVPRA